jgi:hypothetical protein
METLIYSLPPASWRHRKKRESEEAVQLCVLELRVKKRQARPAIFIAEMERVVHWRELEALIEPHYPTTGR